MGCSSSKSLGRKRRGTEYSVPQKAITKSIITTTSSTNVKNKSWYAPVSRTVSEPINYHHIEEEEEEEEEDKEESEVKRVKDRYHVVPLASRSSYGFLKLSDKKDDLGHIYNTFKSFKTELNPVIEEEQEEEEEGMGQTDQYIIHAHHSVDHMETINAWELMEGLDDDDDDIGHGHGHGDDDDDDIGHGHGQGQGHGQEGGKTLNVERSLCFNRIHDLDSCFDQEASSPLWKPYYNDFTTQNPKMQHAPHQHRRFKSCEGLDVVLGEEEEEEEYNGYSYMKKPMKTTTTNSPMRTPPRGHSNNKSPLKSPSVKSPTTMWTFRKSPRSPLIKSPSRHLGGSSTPLFDPSLLAKFEKALQSIDPRCDDWFLVNELCRANQTISIDHLSSSSHNQTLVSYASGSTSTSSSGSDSPQYEVKNTRSSLTSLDIMNRENVHIMSPCPKALPIPIPIPCEDIDMSEFSYGLEDFELRCPPRGEHKVVLYFTSLRGVRKTFQDCCHMRLILQGLKVDVDERDVWMHSKFREELTELLGNKRFQVPRLFVRGRYIGGIEDVSQLHEDGILVGLFEGLPSFGIYRAACQGCDGVRFVPCLTCNGSCKILKDFDRIARCDKCNENGLIMCPLCCNT